MLSIEKIREKASEWLGSDFNEETRKEVRDPEFSDRARVPPARLSRSAAAVPYVTAVTRVVRPSAR